MSNPVKILDAVVREVDGGRRAALSVIVATRGSTPQAAGAMLAVNAEGRMTGTIGGGCVEVEVRDRARDLLVSGVSERVECTLDHDSGLDDGLICGGEMSVAIQVFTDAEATRPLREAADRLRAGEAATLPIRVRSPEGRDEEYRVWLEEPPALVIAGGGHIGRVLGELMVKLGFQVTVIDDRPEFANPERFPAPIEPVVGDIEDTLGRRPIDANTYVVIVTRGHRHDERALSAVLDSEARYIGMIGSRRKIEVIFEDLRKAGAAEERLGRVHAPIGLDIGAITTEEIALAIAAELVKVRREDYRSTVEGPVAVGGEVG
jgi:xanthine dehydrogenase accessory factor